MKKIAASDSRQSVGLKWKLRKGLEENVAFKEDGTMKVGKDIEVDGGATFQGKEMGIYNRSPMLLPSIKNFDDFYERGVFNDLMQADFAVGISYYSLEEIEGEQVPTGRFTGILFDDVGDCCFYKDYHHFDHGMDAGDNEPDAKIWLSDIITNGSKARFIHHIIATTSSGAYKFSYRSDSDVNCGSVADLRTIMHISASGDEEAIACCKSDWTATGCFHITTSVCQVGSANVTAVSDKVVSE